MFRLPLFRIRAFTFGTLSTFLSAVARGGLMFMLIIWLQGIWLPQHGYDFTETPLWAGHLHAAADHRACWPRARRRATSPTASARARSRPPAWSSPRSASRLLMLLPTDFSYPVFGAILLLIGAAMGLFASPNRAAVMNSLPKGDRGAGGAMNQTFQNSAAGAVDRHLLHAHDRRAVRDAARDDERRAAGPRRPARHRAPRGHAAAGVDPLRRLPGLQPDRAPARPARARRPLAHDQAALTGSSFFPNLISGPFQDGLHAAFVFAIVACLIAAGASLLRGGRMVHDDEPAEPAPAPTPRRLRTAELEEQHAG
jgi:hypothetical protein